MFAQNMLVANIDANCEEVASMVKKTYNAKYHNFKSEKQRRFNFKSDPCPKWYADHIENIILAKNFEINNTAYIMEGNDQIFKDSDIDSVSFLNIDVKKLNKIKMDSLNTTLEWFKSQVLRIEG